jgi:GntR family transcriptional regulator
MHISADTSQPDAGRRSPLPPTSVRGARQTLADEVRTAILQELILPGAVRAGEYLPTESDLCTRYQVSRITVRSALSSLQDAGYIHRRQGRGSLVLPRPQTLASGLLKLQSFEKLASDQGAEVSSLDLRIYETELDADSAAKMDRPEGSTALVIERVKAYGQDRVGWIVDVVPYDVLPPAIVRTAFNGSVLDILLDHEELDVAYSDCEVAAVPLDAATAAHLQIPTGSPAFYMDELTRSDEGRIINWSQAWMLSEYFQFTMRRMR